MISRQPSCACGHEAHVMPCEWCLCATSPIPGVYLDPWPVSDWDWLDASPEAT